MNLKDLFNRKKHLRKVIKEKAAKLWFINRTKNADKNALFKNFDSQRFGGKSKK